MEFKFNKKDFPIFDEKDLKMVEKETMNNLNNVLLTIQNSVAEVTPVGATGGMRASLKTIIKKSARGLLKGIVQFGVKYASAVNDGRKASPVSKVGQVGLRRWIEKSSKGRAYMSALKDKYPKVTLKQATYLLARSMKKKKRDGQKFFEEGIENAEPDLNRIVSKLGTTLVKGLAK